MIFSHPPAQPDVTSAAHVVQLALTPIFLLTGVASLLNVFTTRLGRIADQVDKVSGDPQRRPASSRDCGCGRTRSISRC